MGLLEDEQIAQSLGDGPWARAGDAIERELKFADFAESIRFVNAVAAVAEELNHHPDILVHGWNKVRLTVSTHSEGGLTDADFALAARLDELS